jgi:predicted nucleic acid-binding protein
VVQFLDALWAAGAVCWLPLPGFERRLTAVAAAQGVRGLRIFDCQIALMALECGATELWTHDHGFHALPGLPVRDPL